MSRPDWGNPRSLGKPLVSHSSRASDILSRLAGCNTGVRGGRLLLASGTSGSSGVDSVQILPSIVSRDGHVMPYHCDQIN